MQKELDASRPDLDIQLIGVNEWGQQSANPSITDGRDIPWLQDVDNNGDGKSDAWASWGVTYRDVVILDANSEVAEVYNLTQNDLRDLENYDALWQLLIDTASPHPGDCNADGEVDASDLSCVIDAEQRDIVLNILNTLPGDLDGNGDVSFGDFVVLSTNFGRDVRSYTDGNIDLIDGVDFADFVVLANNFGRTPSSHLGDNTLPGGLDVDVPSVNGTTVWYPNPNTDAPGSFGVSPVITNSAPGDALVYIDGVRDSEVVSPSSFLGDDRIGSNLDNGGDMDVLSGSFRDAKLAGDQNTDNAGRQPLTTTETRRSDSVDTVDVDYGGNVDVVSTDSGGTCGPNFCSRREAAHGAADGNSGRASTFEQAIAFGIQDSLNAARAAGPDNDGDADVLSASSGHFARNEQTIARERVMSSDGQGLRQVRAVDGEALAPSRGVDDKLGRYENADGQGNFGSGKGITTRSGTASNSPDAGENLDDIVIPIDVASQPDVVLPDEASTRDVSDPDSRVFFDPVPNKQGTPEATEAPRPLPEVEASEPGSAVPIRQEFSWIWSRVLAGLIAAGGLLLFGIRWRQRAKGSVTVSSHSSLIRNHSQARFFGA